MHTWRCSFKRLLPFLAALSLLMSVMAAAASTVDVLEQAVTMDAVLLYVRHAGGTDVKARIGTDSILGASADGDGGSVPTVTWLLVDNSLSIAKNDRTLTRELLTDLVAGKAANERFVLCTISDHLEPILYDSEDYSELKREIEAIEYHNQETYLTDALSELLDLREQRGGTEYARVFVISDGVDNNPGGLTREELEQRLKDNNIPIYSVGCKGNAQELKEMYSLSRQTGARYWALNDLSGTWEVSSVMSGEEMPARVRVPIPEALCDGSVKGVQVTFSDGAVAQTQATMPFSEKLHLPEAAPVTEPAQIEPIPSEPPAPVETEATLADKMREHWLSIVLAALALVLFVPVVIALRQKKTGESQEGTLKPTPAEENVSQPSLVLAGETGIEDEAKTVYIGGGNAETTGNDATVYMNSDAPAQTQVTLCLQDTERPEMRFEVLLPVASGLRESDGGTGERTVSISHVRLPGDTEQRDMYDELCIGRASSNHIVIDYDRTVSGRHCKLEISGDIVRVFDMGSKNGTFVNGAVVKENEPSIITSGSTLGLGKASFRMELIRR